jgi:ATP-dependent exoDNAse (exonuclease V) beta subunit
MASSGGCVSRCRRSFFYGHVLGFKGLERRAVVLVVNEQSAFERSRERLYVGLSRARDQLVVCGDRTSSAKSAGRISPAV